ncbi:glycosyltransferase family 1 protein [Chryseobacterium lactis]|uniref:Glycosyltransferase family 1 protein n=2 Tax=Chryseobacterium lactis TaxID=1241981 RepID=A0A3G6RSC9_CHRLC|nr:glycosyltransferase family 1 protein [Chryseobacterium lactis]AZB07238.1 glycosyltransferase family 1 protein [Chryseobacterium lactis]PNW11584.1 glycosyltransferase family 1 protein [Chryseobacterium lactis]
MLKIIRVSTVPLSLNVLLKGQLAFLNKYFDIIAVSGKGKHLDIVKEREKIKVVPVEMERKISLFKDFISLVNLYKTFKKEKPEIIHSITPKAGLLSMLAGKMAGVPIRMHTFTGLIFPTHTGAMQKLLIYMDRLLCMAATHVYPEGKGVESDLKTYKITNKPLKIIANGNVNGIDLQHYHIGSFTADSNDNLRKELNIDSKDFIFIFIGRLVKDKGINELVKVFSEYKRENVKLLLVGPFEDDLDPLKKETYVEIENNSNIICVGFQKDVRPYFAISNALVFPSYREGFPNVVMQAGAMGLPAIVTDINGCNEIIKNEENGLIIQVKNEEEIKRAMERMVNDQELYLKMKGKARQMIEDRYDQVFVWNELLEEYNLLLAERK